MITAVSIGAVGLLAIGANLGVILGRADETKVDTTSAAGGLVAANTSVVNVELQPQTNPLVYTSAATDGSQHFTIDTAGSVDVSAGAGVIYLNRVSLTHGWTSIPVDTFGTDLALLFSDGTRTLHFSAVLGPNRKVIGDLTELPR